MAPVEPPTYRLSRIPAQVSGPDLGHFLCEVIPDLDLKQIRICSLAPTPDDHNKPPTQSATIQIFGLHPKSIEFDGNGECTKEIKGHRKPLLIDKHFLGFTPLNHVDSGNHAFDLIALSGLASHPFGSWKKHASTSGSSDAQQKAYMWLRDELPSDFPNMRVMIYGYDTKLLKSESEQTIEDLAIAFNSSLKAIGKARTSTKPLLIFAHSLGGLIIKKALSLLAGSGESEVFILHLIRLLMLFGVPGTGMKMEYLLPMVDGQPNESLIKCLSEADEQGVLKALNTSFDGISLLRQIRLISAYETQRTRTAQEKSPGVWDRIRDPVFLVSRASAIQKGSRDPQDVFPIDRDHSDMVKFTEGDVSYSRVKGFLHELFEAQELWPETTPSPPVALANLSGRLPLHESEQSPIYDEHALESLFYEELQTREDQIAVAYKQSYDWLFDPAIGLRSWLHGTGRLFWIQGKPGSGKSTMMRHIQQILNSQEDESSKTGIAHVRSFEVMWFFFHARGSYLQKSFEGLLRSILYQLANVFAPVARVIGEHYKAKPAQGRDVWTEDELLHLFQTVRSKVTVSKEAVLFLDALDEFNGHPETIADFLANLTSNPIGKQNLVIRICFSGRPRDVFVEQFGACDGFRLQDWTMSDIERYARGRLRDILVSRSIETNSNPLNELTEYITNRAEGVFLWVKLVLDELQSLPDRSSEILLSQLTRIPTELPDYYARTIKQIAPRDRLDTFLILELLLRSPVGITPLRDLFYAFRCAKGTTYDECRRQLEIATTEISDDQAMCTRMKDLCCGLIEVVNHEAEAPKPVQFMHETVKEYVSSPHFRQNLSPNIPRDLVDHNGYLFWTKYMFSIGSVDEYSGFGTRMCRALKDQVQPEFFSWYHRNLLCATSRHAESSTGRDFASYLESIPESVFSGMEAPNSSIWFNSRLSFAVVAGLQLCVACWLSIAATKSTDGPAKFLNSNPRIPLAHIVCAAASSSKFKRERAQSLSSVHQLLISHGMDIQAELDGLMPFQRLYGLSRLRYNDYDCPKILVEVVKLMLDAGSSPNTRIRLPSSPRKGSLFPKVKVYPCRALHICPLNLITILLNYGAEVNAYDSDGFTPLDVLCSIEYGGAIGIRTVSAAKKLLEAGAHLSQKGYSSYRRRIDERKQISDPDDAALLRLLEEAPVLKDRPTKAHLKALYADFVPPGDPKAPPHQTGATNTRHLGSSSSTHSSNKATSEGSGARSNTAKGKQVARNMLAFFRRDK